MLCQVPETQRPRTTMVRMTDRAPALMVRSFMRKDRTWSSKQLLIYSCDECLKRKKYRVLGVYIKDRPCLKTVPEQLPFHLSWNLNVDFLGMNRKGKWGLPDATWNANGLQSSLCLLHPSIQIHSARNVDYNKVEDLTFQSPNGNTRQINKS